MENIDQIPNDWISRNQGLWDEVYKQARHNLLKIIARDHGISTDDENALMVAAAHQFQMPVDEMRMLFDDTVQGIAKAETFKQLYSHLFPKGENDEVLFPLLAVSKMTGKPVEELERDIMENPGEFADGVHYYSSPVSPYETYQLNKKTTLKRLKFVRRRLFIECMNQTSSENKRVLPEQKAEGLPGSVNLT